MHTSWLIVITIIQPVIILNVSIIQSGRPVNTPNIRPRCMQWPNEEQAVISAVRKQSAKFAVVRTV